MVGVIKNTTQNTTNTPPCLKSRGWWLVKDVQKEWRDKMFITMWEIEDYPGRELTNIGLFEKIVLEDVGTKLRIDFWKERGLDPTMSWEPWPYIEPVGGRPDELPENTKNEITKRVFDEFKKALSNGAFLFDFDDAEEKVRAELLR